MEIAMLRTCRNRAGGPVRVSGVFGRQAAMGGFSLFEMMVSLTLFLLGVVTAGGAMVVTEQSARAMEERYLDHAELRNRIEDFKSSLSKATAGGVGLDSTSLTSAVTSLLTLTGASYSSKVEGGAAGLPNLVRVEMTAVREGEEPPATVVTYVRIVE
jgi:hypothetical protein